jgi:hypothetical protein
MRLGEPIQNTHPVQSSLEIEIFFPEGKILRAPKSIDQSVMAYVAFKKPNFIT